MPGALQAAPFIALGLLLVTLPHHWRVRNIATLSIIAWLSAYNLMYGVGAVVWDRNDEIRATVWCDIVTKIKIGADAGLPGCCLCMAKQLNRIAYGLDMSPRGWKHRTLDILLCWGLPVIVMALHYIVQGHRFDIIEDIGCIPAIYVSWLSIIILDFTAFVPAILALIYCGLALFKLGRRRRLALRIMLNKPDSALTPSRYIRLMILTFFLGTWSILLISVSASNEYTEGLQLWTDWASVHEDFSRIVRSRTTDFSAPTLRCIYMLWWAVPLSSLPFFAFFGIGEEAMKDYRASASWVGRVVLRRQPAGDPIRADMVSVDASHSPGLGRKPIISLSDRMRPLPPIPYDVRTFNQV
ncbi:fungal pheromone STE3G-protein-coupled receptor [Mycena albidolilacea]|uniref:Fungal pheromone STE3G-protein-coupled receptor n=1 Tax=Mycena albidolilacea TaxID=1033008 RepID=A0AAD6ZUG5_9AGAR|nr:fungal pheromone STE3G-protein-coupled receptor [Mycena albidolilacea]